MQCMTGMLQQALDLSLEGRYTTPEMFLPATSIFSVFTDFNRSAIGVDGLWRPNAYWDIAAAWQAILLESSSGAP